MPKYISDLFQMRNTERNQRGSRNASIQPLLVFTPSDILLQNTWNKLTEDLRSLTSLNEFRTKIFLFINFAKDNSAGEISQN